MGNSGHPRKIAKTVINIHPRIQKRTLRIKRQPQNTPLWIQDSVPEKTLRTERQVQNTHPRIQVLTIRVKKEAYNGISRRHW
ncbi:uncharacterized protein [Lolium perenne]